MRPRSSPKLNRVLLAILMLSVFGFFGIVFYAYRWDAGQSAMGEGTEGTKEEQETSSHDMTVLPIPEIASMSRSMPRLVRVAEADSEYIEVPLISQKEVGYTTGCELVSAAMVLNYYGKNVTTDDVYEVIDKITPTGRLLVCRSGAYVYRESETIRRLRLLCGTAYECHEPYFSGRVLCSEYQRYAFGNAGERISVAGDPGDHMGNDPDERARGRGELGTGGWKNIPVAGRRALSGAGRL